MMRRIFWILAFLAALGLALPDIAVIGFDTAYAQVKKKKKRRNLFELLFKRKKRKKSAKSNRNSLRKNRKLTRKRKKRRRKIAVVPVIPKVVKSENAAKILVVGDFMANGTAWGLQRLFASDPDVIVVDKTTGLSGLVREDVANWPATIPGLLEETKAVVVVVLVGMNDRQQMRTSGGRFNKLTDEWKKQYVARSQALARAASATKLVWVGLPPVKRTSMVADYLVFNEIYRNAAESVGGVFVDVWDGYTNAEGKFITAGPDIKGQIVRLRSSDGINMTKAGKRKLAFYAEKAIRKATGLGTGQLIANLPGFNVSTQPLKPEYDPAGTGRTVVVSLDGPALDGGEVLEGGDLIPDLDSGKKSVSFELVSKGSASFPQKGRIDEGWGLPKIETSKTSKDQKAEKKPAVDKSAVPVTRLRGTDTVLPSILPQLPTSLPQAPAGTIKLPAVTNIEN